MLIVILGHTASGTSFLIKESGLKRIKEFTTRPKRFEEEDEYHFITKEELEELKNMVFFKVDYKVKDKKTDVYSYGLFEVDIKKAIESKDYYLLRTNIECYNKLKSKNIIPKYTILLECTNYKELYNRIVKRNNLDETIRRYFSDLDKLKEIKKNKNIIVLESDENLIENFKKVIHEGE